MWARLEGGGQHGDALLGLPIAGGQARHGRQHPVPYLLKTCFGISMTGRHQRHLIAVQRRTPQAVQEPLVFMHTIMRERYTHQALKGTVSMNLKFRAGKEQAWPVTPRRMELWCQSMAAFTRACRCASAGNQLSATCVQQPAKLSGF